MHFLSPKQKKLLLCCILLRPSSFLRTPLLPPSASKVIFLPLDLADDLGFAAVGAQFIFCVAYFSTTRVRDDFDMPFASHAHAMPLPALLARVERASASVFHACCPAEGTADAAAAVAAAVAGAGAADGAADGAAAVEVLRVDFKHLFEPLEQPLAVRHAGRAFHSRAFQHPPGYRPVALSPQGGGQDGGQDGGGGAAGSLLSLIPATRLGDRLATLSLRGRARSGDSQGGGQGGQGGGQGDPEAGALPVGSKGGAAVAARKYRIRELGPQPVAHSGALDPATAKCGVLTWNLNGTLPAQADVAAVIAQVIKASVSPPGGGPGGGPGGSGKGGGQEGGVLGLLAVATQEYSKVSPNPLAPTGRGLGEWFDLLVASAAESGGLVPLAFECIGATTLAVFIRADLFYKASRLDCSRVALGPGGVLVNKGGVGVALTLFDRRICFISAHLAAHQEKVRGLTRVAAPFQMIHCTDTIIST